MVHEYEVRAAISDAYDRYGWEFAYRLELEYEHVMRHKTGFDSRYPMEDKLKSIIDASNTGVLNFLEMIA